MFHVATTSVAMKNSKEPVKRHAAVRLEYSNVRRVAYYINKFLDNPEQKLLKVFKNVKKWRQDTYVTADLD